MVKFEKTIGLFSLGLYENQVRNPQLTFELNDKINRVMDEIQPHL